MGSSRKLGVSTQNVGSLATHAEELSIKQDSLMPEQSEGST